MLEDYMGLNLAPLLDRAALVKRITKMTKKKWTSLLPRYKSEYLKNETEHPIANYEKEFVERYGAEAESLKDELNHFHNPLEALAHYTHKGLLPPPELLCAITEIYEVYITRKGESALDELMFGEPPKQNSKRSFAGRLGDEMKDSAFYLDVGKADGQIPLIELATNYINKNYPDPTLRPDIDSFLRTFRNKKKQK
jgi:hypothetical protein